MDGRRLAGDAPTATEPVFVGRRQEHLYARVRARLDVAGTGGLSVRIDPRTRWSSRCPTAGCAPCGPSATSGTSSGRRTCRPTASWRSGCCRTRRAAPSSAAGPTSWLPGSSDGDGFTELGRVDGRYLSTEVAGGMTGRMVGVVAVDGSVLVRSFEYVGADDPAALSVTADLDDLRSAFAGTDRRSTGGRRSRRRATSSSH